MSDRSTSRTAAARQENTGPRGSETSMLRAGDNHFVHPWEALADFGNNARTVITRGEGIHLYDSDGNAMIDGPGGMCQCRPRRRSPTPWRHRSRK